MSPELSQTETIILAIFGILLTLFIRVTQTLLVKLIRWLTDGRTSKGN